MHENPHPKSQRQSSQSKPVQSDPVVSSLSNHHEVLPCHIADSIQPSCLGDISLVSSQGLPLSNFPEQSIETITADTAADCLGERLGPMTTALTSVNTWVAVSAFPLDCPSNKYNCKVECSQGSSDSIGLSLYFTSRNSFSSDTPPANSIIGAGCPQSVTVDASSNHFLLAMAYNVDLSTGSAKEITNAYITCDADVNGFAPTRIQSLWNGVRSYFNYGASEVPGHGRRLLEKHIRGAVPNLSSESPSEKN